MSHLGSMPTRVAPACILLLSLSSAAAQGIEWDPHRYEDLSQSGQDLYHEAMDVPDGSAQRRTLLLTARDHMKEALSMVRIALSEGLVDAAETEALVDLFVLRENLITVWLHLDACRPAERLLLQASADPVLPPELYDRLFRPLHSQVDACRERTGLWHWGEYAVLVRRALNLRDEAELASLDDEGVASDPDPEILYNAAQVSLRALEMYRPALFEGTLTDPPITDLAEELFIRYDTTITLLVRSGHCEQAHSQLVEAGFDIATLLQVDEDRLAESSAMVAECLAPPVVEEVVPESDLRRAGAWTLIGTAGAMGLGILILDLTSISDRDELDALRSQCAAGPCDYDRAASLADSIDNRKLVAGVLLGGALVSATAGVVLLLTGRDDDVPASEPALSLGVLIGPSQVGATLEVSY